MGVFLHEVHIHQSITVKEHLVCGRLLQYSNESVSQSHSIFTSSPRHCFSDTLFLLFLISLFLSVSPSLNNEGKGRKGKLLRQQSQGISLKIEVVVTPVTNFLFTQNPASYHFAPPPRKL